MKLLDNLVLDLICFDLYETNSYTGFDNLINLIRSTESFKKALFWATNSFLAASKIENHLNDSLSKYLKNKDFVICGLLLLLVDSGNKETERIAKGLLDNKSMVNTFILADSFLLRELLVS